LKDYRTENRRTPLRLNLNFLILSEKGLQSPVMGLRLIQTISARRLPGYSQAGWKPQAIEAILSLGAVLESEAQLAIGRSATLEDVTSVRNQLAAEQLRIEFDALWNEHASAAIDNGDRAELANGLRSIANEIEG
jgi:hypothetical protein